MSGAGGAGIKMVSKYGVQFMTYCIILHNRSQVSAG